MQAKPYIILVLNSFVDKIFWKKFRIRLCSFVILLNLFIFLVFQVFRRLESILFHGNVPVTLSRKLVRARSPRLAYFLIKPQSETGKCKDWQWKCEDGTCIDQIDRCNNRPDCPDKSDESDCGHCEPEEFRCSNGTCLNAAKRCDGEPDCPHSEDEEGCG